MKFGVSIGNFGQFGKRGGANDLVDVAERAEQMGYDSVWVHDHIFMPARIHARYPYNESGVAGFAWRQDIYDPLAMMAAVAVRTRRVSIGTSVLIIPYRNPLALAKMLATLDCLSHGRIVLGIGVGWMTEEFEALGMGDYYPVRGRVTDEWMRICIEMWTGEGTSGYDGRYHSFQGVGAFPKPVQKPHIPIWVGGKGEVAARRVARYGSGYHTIASTPEDVAQELQIVRRELDKRGRDLSEIEVSMLGGISLTEGAAWSASTLIGGSKQQIIDRLAEYEKAGLHHLVGTPTSVEPTRNSPQRLMEDMQYLAEEIIPALR
jgi:probable F420-dependent oxidoreductase